MRDSISVKGARENNLKNIDVEIPRNQLVVMTGLSGSGKSSLAFDTIFAEGQRRYVESLSSYARQFLGQMDKPDVDSIDGMSPAISIDQKTTSRNPRSTVGTVTEIYDYLRLLWARVGIPHCPKCGKEIKQQTVDQIVDQILLLPQATRVQILAPVVRARKGVKISQPVQSCMFIKGNAAGQAVHNIVVVEEGAELNILGGCATSQHSNDAAHLGITEYYVEKGGKLTFTMIHNWGDSTTVRPRSAGVVEAGGVFQNNYILLKSVGSLESYPRIDLNGEGAVATFNSVIVTPTGSYVDSGSAIHLNAPHTRGEIISRTLTTGGTIINRGFIGASATPVKGHLECKGLIVGGGRVHAIPELDSCRDGVELSHEAAVGKIAQEEIEYLMARGLDEDEATSTIVRGFLNVDIMGLPAPLKKAMDEQISKLNAGGAM